MNTTRSTRERLLETLSEPIKYASDPKVAYEAEKIRRVVYAIVLDLVEDINELEDTLLSILNKADDVDSMRNLLN